MIFGDAQPTSQPELAKAYRSAAIIALALTLSIVLYIMVGLVVLRNRAIMARDDLLVPFYATAAVFAFGALVYRRIQMNVTRLEGVAVRRGIPGLLAHLVTTTVISGALAEVVALTGLALSLLGGDSTHVIRLGIVALAVSIYNYPRRSSWRKAVDYFAAALSHQP